MTGMWRSRPSAGLRGLSGTVVSAEHNICTLTGQPFHNRGCQDLLENRIRLMTCESSGCQAAREYSLIRPPRTGFR